MVMALHYASITHFHLHSFLNSKGLFLKNTHQLRFSESPKTKTRSQLNTMMATCSLHPIPLYTSNATDGIETITTNFPQKLQAIASTYTQELLIADLDPTTAKTAIAITGPFLSVLGFLFIIRIVMSWYPKLPVGKFPYVVAYAPTEPILKLTRKLIPPLGGVDVTPVVWFALVSFLSEILVGPQGLLVLLSQQIQS